MKRVLSGRLKMVLTLAAALFLTVALRVNVYAGSTFSSAKVISFNTQYSDTLSDTNTTYFYKITLTKSGTVNLKFRADNIYHINMNFYSADAKSLGSASPYWDSSSKVISTTWSYSLNKGAYYVQISRASGDGTFSLTPSFTDGGETFSESGSGDDNSMAYAHEISMNKTYNGFLSKLNDGSGDKDYYKFTLPSSGKLTFNAYAGMYHIYYYIYSSDGQQVINKSIYWNDNTQQSTLNESYELIKGTYYLGVVTASSYYGKYHFNFSFVSAGESFTETGKDEEMTGANSISLGTTYKGQLALNEGERDYYRFAAPSGGTVTVTANAEMYHVYYYIVDTNGSTVWYKSVYWDSTTKKSRISESVTGLTAGSTYYFLVKRASSNYGNYSFSIVNPNAPKAASSTTNTASTNTASSNSVAGTPAAKVTTEEKVNNVITTATTDKDISYSSYSLLRARAKKTTNKTITVQWTKVSGAYQYVIYGNKCGKGYKKLKQVASTKTSWKQTGLKKGTYYKYIVIAVDENRNAIASSKTIHVATSGGKKGNHKSVKILNGKSVTLKVGKTRKISAKAVPKSTSKKVSVHRKLAYESTNTNIATVTKAGKIKAKKAGVCYIYVYAQNGVYARVKVTVK